MNKVQEFISRMVSAKNAKVASRFVNFLRRMRLPGIISLASPPDTDSLFVSLEVENRACLDGGNNLPSSSEEVISGAQRDIVDYHRKLHDRARGKVAKRAAKLLVEARRIEPSAVADRLRDIPSKVQNKIDRALAEFDSQLKVLRAQEIYEQQCLDRGNEQPEDDESGGSAIKAVFFVIMLMVAGLASLALGSDILWGSEAGSLLNSESAIAVAIVSVTLPFLIAVAVSKPVSAKLNRQRPAFQLAMLLTMVLLVFFAFSCAHLIIVSADPLREGGSDISAAINAMATDPGAFRGDVNALKGIVIVLVTGCLGFVLGNLSVNAKSENDDARSAYLNVVRERERLTGQIRERVNSIVDAAEADVNRSARRVQEQFKKLSGLVEQATETQATYDDFLASLEESCNLLLERYRQANEAARSTAVPPSFSEQICFRLEGASRRAFFEDGIERHRQTGDEMEGFSEIVAKVRRDLRDLNTGTIKKLGTVETQEESDESFAYT